MYIYAVCRGQNLCTRCTLDPLMALDLCKWYVESERLFDLPANINQCSITSVFCQFCERQLQELGQYGKCPIVSSCHGVDYEIVVVELCA